MPSDTFENLDPGILHIGLDVGSTTIKTVVIDGFGKILHQSYERHFSEVRKTMVGIIVGALDKFPDRTATLAVAGSGGISASKLLGAEFVQEVVAGAEAIRRLIPRTDVAIELGGEDAKLTFFDAGIDQRMNETCAGGTGAFIDQMAAFLRTDPQGLNELAKKATTIFPIAARCGVFAKADILPLLNEGAAQPDIAASIFQSVVDQTIGGLACGRRICGNVAFLGGPLFFLSELRKRFIETLKLAPQEVICPAEAQLFVALGAAFISKNTSAKTTRQWTKQAKDLEGLGIVPEISPLPPLFANLQQLKDFRERHERARLPRADWPDCGNVFLGLDAGSTTTKLVALDAEKRLVYSHYGPNYGNPLKSAMLALLAFYEAAPPSVRVTRSVVTGYGEALIQAALGVDLGEVETVAHYKAAASFVPDVSFIVDIGGQDIKCLSVKNGIIEKLMLNEACSSGCGSFLATFAGTLGLDPEGFARMALLADRPVDLGSRCTVFMNSKVKQAQKEGAQVGDISAGLSYSVVRNALYKVIRISRPEELGEKIVVQGGTFFNDAVLRSFELSTERDVVRPDIAGLMGAFGAALIGLTDWQDDPKPSTLISQSDLQGFSVSARNLRCKKCENHCLLTINSFSDGRRFISGNRCERGAGTKSQTADRIDALANKARLGDISERLAKLPTLGGLGRQLTDFDQLPNLFAWNLYRLFQVYKPHSRGNCRGRVGIPRALGLYETYPFWFTFFNHLGFRVELSPPSSKDLFNSALDTIPSQTVCYPAKLVHGHILALLKERVDFIFFPCAPRELPAIYPTVDRYNCPLVGSYPELIRLNLDAIGDSGVKLCAPFVDLAAKTAKLAQRLGTELSFLRLSMAELKAAITASHLEQKRYRADIRSAGERALSQIRKANRRAVVLAGHPYHIDPEIHHGIADLITANGLGVLSSDSIDHLAPSEINLRVRDQWIPHSRLYRAAMVCAANEELELVQLNSFGCGLDAVTTDQVAEIIKQAGKVYTLLKIDEGANLGAARIRVRSLLAAIKERGRKKAANSTDKVYSFAPTTVQKGMEHNYTLIAPQMSPIHFRFLAPALAPLGYDIRLIPHLERQAVDEGLRYVNNDACFPALVSIGQIIHELKKGDIDVSRTAVLMSQTGGGCRASNYVAFLRKALSEAQLGEVPVLPWTLSGQGESAMISIDRAGWRRILMGLLTGDMLQRLTLATRPYEIEPGSSEALFEKWVPIASRAVATGDKKAFHENIETMADEFAALELHPADKPRVGVVGEILINFHPEANNQVIAILENEGGQAILPELTDFFLYCLYDEVYRYDHLTGRRLTKWINNWLIGFVEKYRSSMRRALARHPRFGHLNSFRELKSAGEGLVSLGNQSGEGWYLAADMVLMLENGINNILCLQPFGCLPNHITGKGVVKELKRRYPEANLAAVDYDPGASEVNQLNRIKLMMSVAKAAQNEKLDENLSVVGEMGMRRIKSNNSERDRNLHILKYHQ
ncbi:MAG: acyl-CoA dehydratase activase-related protein [Deltaproteobacteria bacterium]|jgi:predicted CoA-substrate-specific enzyme activase|nr:acyl-CoA dehydratase activase-related protein [Deltaproteobacteria bacterium]